MPCLLAVHAASKSASCGFGYLAFAGLAAASRRGRESAGAEDAALHAEGQARDLHVHARRRRRTSTRSTTSRKLAQPTTASTIPPAAARAASCSKSPFKFTQARPERPADLRVVSRSWPSRPTTCACSTAWTPTCRTIRRPTVQLHTGNFQFVRPSMGAWVLYGLGTENQELPGFITINPIATRRRRAELRQRVSCPPRSKARASAAKGSSSPRPRSPTSAIRKLRPRPSASSSTCCKSFNRERLERRQGEQRARRRDRVVRARLPHARRGAASDGPRPDESRRHARRLRHRPARPTDDFGRQCLLARRFAEAGVRFIEIAIPAGTSTTTSRHGLTRNCRRDRQADRRAAGRSEAARHAQGHAGGVGRRVRPHARRRRTATAATTTPPASPCGWPAAA